MDVLPLRQFARGRFTARHFVSWCLRF